jgi:hypothetical protein
MTRAGGELRSALREEGIHRKCGRSCRFGRQPRVDGHHPLMNTPRCSEARASLVPAATARGIDTPDYSISRIHVSLPEAVSEITKPLDLY